MLIASGAAAWLSGCSTGPVPTRPREPLVADQGGQWEVVFLPVSTRVAAEEATRGWVAEESRRDAALSARGPEVVLAASHWPEPARASLERPRRVRLERDARDLLFFRPRWDGGRHHHHGHDHDHGIVFPTWR